MDYLLIYLNFRIPGLEFDKTQWDYYNRYLLQKMLTLYPSNRISAKELCVEPLIKAFMKAWDGKLEKMFRYNAMLFNRVINERKLKIMVPFF